MDLNQKEDSWRCITQSFEEYRQKREASHSVDYVISSGVVEAVEGIPRQNSKGGGNISGDRPSYDAILKLKSEVRRSERKIN